MAYERVSDQGKGINSGHAVCGQRRNEREISDTERICGVQKPLAAAGSEVEGMTACGLQKQVDISYDYGAQGAFYGA